MRPSSKTKLLDAAVAVVAREGIAGLTLEGVAGEAGLTKAGLLYHFPSKELLVLAVQVHVVGRLEEDLLAELGEPLEDASAERRMATYAGSVLSGAVRDAELRFMLESLAHPELAGPWDAFMERWAPLPSTTTQPALDLLLARMALDGLWLFDSTSSIPLTPAVHEALVGRIKGLVGTPDLGS